MITLGRVQILSWQHFLTLHFLCIFWGYLSLNFPLMILALCVNFGIVLAHRGAFKFTIVDTRRFLVLMICFAMILMLPFATIRTDFAAFHVATGISSTLAAYFITLDFKSAANAVRNALIASQVFILIYLQTASGLSFPLDYLIEGASSNGVTSFLIVLQASYLLMLSHRSREVALITAAITLYICFVGFGRGSIVAAIITFIASVAVYGFFIERRLHRYWFIVLQLIFVMILIYFFSASIYKYILDSTKLFAGFVDVHRELMFVDYLAAMDFWTTLIGSGYSGMSIETIYNGNPHSSLIRMHHLFGMPYFFSISAVFCVAIFPKKVNAQYIFDLAVIAAVFFRLATEPLLFPTMLDIFFFIGVFAIIQKREKDDSPVHRGMPDVAANYRP